MARNGNGQTNGKIKLNGAVSERVLRNLADDLRLANRAVQKAQEENRRLGIPNWYMINGEIVSDTQIAEIKNKTKA